MDLFERLNLHLLMRPDDGAGDGDGDGDGKPGDGDGKPAGDGDGDGKPADDRKPPWGSDDEFDPPRAWKLIEGLRGDLDKVKKDREEKAAELKKRDDATKSDADKLEERATEAEKRATEAEGEASRLRVVIKKGLTGDPALALAKRLVGASEEELDNDADELLESFKTDDGGEAPRGRPKERLRPGAAPSADAEPSDPEKLAEQVPRGW